MLLEGKNAVVYGGGGGIGGAVARAFAREGARVFLAGRTRERLEGGHEPHAVASIEEQTMLGRAATLEDVGNVAAFVASDRARTMTAATAHISCGALIDR
jgi:NAD(P)-dependent dehydrogenase (short-subunit alcohol dehydrogenase family)